MISAWYLATSMHINNTWKTQLQGAQSEHVCFVLAKRKWAEYWSNGNANDKDLTTLCYNDNGGQRYWIRCHKSGYCTLK